MPPKIKIQGVPPYDGEYELPTAGFTGRETHYIKHVSGLRPAEYDEASNNLDPDLMLAFASIALRRLGHQVDMELWDANLEECFEVIPDVETEDADRPPARATPGGSTNEPGVAANESENSESSGNPGNGSGENPEAIHPIIGSPGSKLAASDRATSGI